MQYVTKTDITFSLSIIANLQIRIFVRYKYSFNAAETLNIASASVHEVP